MVAPNVFFFSFQDIEAFEELKSGSRQSNTSRLDFLLLADIQDDLDTRSRRLEPESPDMTIRCSSGASLTTPTTPPTVSSGVSSRASAVTPEWDNNFMDWVTYEKVNA